MTWICHPNWYWIWSKHTLPRIDHPYAPKTWYLSEVDPTPADCSNYILKPLFSFAGTGVNPDSDPRSDRADSTRGASPVGSCKSAWSTPRARRAGRHRRESRDAADVPQAGRRRPVTRWRSTWCVCREGRSTAWTTTRASRGSEARSASGPTTRGGVTTRASGHQRPRA